MPFYLNKSFVLFDLLVFHLQRSPKLDRCHFTRRYERNQTSRLHFRKCHRVYVHLEFPQQHLDVDGREGESGAAH